MAYLEFKDLSRKTAFDKVMRDKTFNVAKNPKYAEYQTVLASMVQKFFDKETSCGTVKSKIVSNQELHTPIIRKFEKRKVHFSFIDHIWGADLADRQLISKYYVLLMFSVNTYGLLL